MHTITVKQKSRYRWKIINLPEHWSHTVPQIGLTSRVDISSSGFLSSNSSSKPSLQWNAIVLKWLRCIEVYMPHELRAFRVLTTHFRRRLAVAMPSMRLWLRPIWTQLGHFVSKSSGNGRSSWQKDRMISFWRKKSRNKIETRAQVKMKL